MSDTERTLSATPIPPTAAAGNGDLFKDTSSTAYALLDLLINIPDPDLVLERAGLRRCDLRKLETDDEIYAAMETRRDAAIETPWRLERLKDTPEAPTAWLWGLLEPHIESLMRGSWNAVPYGYSVLECVYAKLPGGRIGISHISEKPMEWFRPTPDGQLVAAFGDHTQALDTELKFILTRRNPTFRNPYGEALLSRLYWPWFFRHNAWRFWMQFMERFGDPLLLGKVDNPQSFVNALIGMGFENHVAVGKEEDVSAVTVGLAGEFSRLEVALVKRVQKVILGQTLTSDIPSGGSLAAAKVHEEVREDRRNADLRMLRKSGQQLVNALWALNRFAGTPPDFVLADGQGLEADRADRDQKLHQAGVRFTPQYLLRVYDFEDGDFELNADVSKPPSKGTVLRAEAGKLQFTKRQQEVEALADSVVQGAAQPVPEEAIRAAVRSASSPEDLADRLAALLTEHAPTAVQSALDRAIYAADILGYLQEREGGPVGQLDNRRAAADAERAEAELQISREVLASLRSVGNEQ